MPPNFTIGLNDIISTTAKGEYQGQTVMNVFHYKAFITSPITDGVAELERINETFDNMNWDNVADDAWQSLVTTTYRMDWFQSQVIYPTRRFYIRRLIGENGTLAGAGCPSNTGLTVNWQTEFATRGRSGSKHFTGLEADSFSGNRIDAGVTADWQGLQTKLLTPILTVAAVGEFVPVVWSMAHPGTPSEVVLATALDEVRIMRRRTFRIGI